MIRALDIHIYGNLVAGGLCLLTFLSILGKIRRFPSNLNIFSIFLSLFFLFMCVSFGTQATFEISWDRIEWEFLSQIVVVLLVVLYLYMLLGNKIVFSREESQSPKDKFDKMKDEFLSVASHELRTPLSVINGFAEILVREKLGSLNDEQKRRVRKILLQGQRLNHIIDELLDLSRIRSGKIECRREVFDIVPVLKAALDDHQIVCEQQKIELLDEIPDILPDVVGDLERVTQIIVNLLNNAIKYTDPGGQVRITASFDKEKKEVIVHLVDTGIGIAKEEQERVFEEFYRAKQQQGKKYSGSGLGLTIVKQLVEAQGGRVSVISEGLGQGSDFFFTLPAAKDGKSSSPQYIRPLSS